MTRFRADRGELDEVVARVVPALRAVSRSAPARPRWVRLYVALIGISVVAAVAHLLIRHSVLRQIVDAGWAAVSFVALVVWVRANRVALTRVDEPDAGIGSPSVRIVRSRPRARDEESVLLPFDLQ